MNQPSYPKLEMVRASDTEDYSDVKTEDEEAQPMMVKPAIKPAGGLWKKVGRKLSSFCGEINSSFPKKRIFYLNFLRCNCFPRYSQVAKNVDDTKEAKVEDRSPWKDLSTAIMEERWKKIIEI